METGTIERARLCLHWVTGNHRGNATGLVHHRHHLAQRGKKKKPCRLAGRSNLVMNIISHTIGMQKQSNQNGKDPREIASLLQSKLLYSPVGALVRITCM